MTDKTKIISNPLTVIAIFAGLAEVAGTVMLGLIDPSIQKIFVWFVMLFPTFLVGLFFWILNKNHKSLYSPSDFKDDKSFLQALPGVRDNFDDLQSQFVKLTADLKEYIRPSAVIAVETPPELGEEEIKVTTPVLPGIEPFDPNSLELMPSQKTGIESREAIVVLEAEKPQHINQPTESKDADFYKLINLMNEFGTSLAQAKETAEDALLREAGLEHKNSKDRLKRIDGNIVTLLKERGTERVMWLASGIGESEIDTILSLRRLLKMGLIAEVEPGIFRIATRSERFGSAGVTS